MRAPQGDLHGQVRPVGRGAHPPRASTRATPTRWCAARSSLPHGTGKERPRRGVRPGRQGPVEAAAAGADEVGGEDLVERIEAGWLEFDVALATPDMMGKVGKLGRILGRRGLMPNPKSGTVTFDLERVINEVKGGRVEFKVDKGGIIHVPSARPSFEPDQLRRQPGRPDRRGQPRPAQGGQGPVLQEPDGGSHHGPGHPRGCPGPPGPGSGLTAGPASLATSTGASADPPSERRSATDSVASEAPFGVPRRQGPHPGLTDRTEIVDGPAARGDVDGHAEAGVEHGPPSSGAARQRPTLCGTRAGVAVARCTRMEGGQMPTEAKQATGRGARRAPLERRTPRSSRTTAGLSVADLRKVRRDLRERDIELRVIKNRLGAYRRRAGGSHRARPAAVGPERARDRRRRGDGAGQEPA